MKVYVLVADYPHDAYVTVFSSQDKRAVYIQELIKQINEYHPNLKTVEDLEIIDIYLSSYDEEVI